MRTVFADQYNLIVIQCDYFGNEYMQASNKINISLNFEQYKHNLSNTDYHLIKHESNLKYIINILSGYSCVLNANEVMNENNNLFNDIESSIEYTYFTLRC